MDPWGPEEGDSRKGLFVKGLYWAARPAIKYLFTISKYYKKPPVVPKPSRCQASSPSSLQGVPRDVLFAILRKAGGSSAIGKTCDDLRAATRPPVPVDTSTVKSFFESLIDMSDELKTACLDWAVCVGLDVEHSMTLKLAANLGDIGILRWLKVLEMGKWELRHCAMAAAARGHTHVLAWMAANTVDAWAPAAFERAASGGHVDTMAWLIGNGHRVGNFEQAAISAAMNGHLRALEYMRLCRFHYPSSSVLIHAVRGGNIASVMWLRKEGCQWFSGAFHDAVSRFSLGELKWMRHDGCPWGYDTFSNVLDWKSDIMEWLFAEGCPFSAYDCAAAALYCRLDVLKWMRAKGFPLDARVLTSAVYAANIDIVKLEIVQWLFANGCEHDSSVFANAAYNGSVGILETLKANGCDWDRRAYENAVLYNNYDAIKWLRDNGCPGSRE